MSWDEDARQFRPATRLVHAGRRKDLTGPFVNPPVVHASTVLFESTEAMYSGRSAYTYGRRGTPTTVALETAISEMSGADGTVLCPSGLNAIALAILSLVEAGDHILAVDSLYQPGRHFAETALARLGVRTTYYDPTSPAAEILALARPETRLVYVESPGSITFEMQDIPALAALARERGLAVVVDNTWATPHLCDALALGADVTLLAATKYIAGHSDVMLGTVSAKGAAWRKVKDAHGALGLCAGPDDVFLALRGLRTLDLRLRRQMEAGLAVAHWLETRSEVARVLHPGLPSHPGHVIWKRDLSGASGLFSFVLDGWSEPQACAFLDRLTLFGLGYSWGGFESLAILGSHGLIRTASPRPAGPVIRLHIGLEEPDDLIADLAAAFEAGRSERDSG